MGKFKDLSGQRFGRLTVIERTEDVIYGFKKNVCYLCKCDCGNTTKVLAKQLRNGGTKSCGCYQKELAREKMKE
jgi:hypothetical protein